MRAYLVLFTAILLSSTLVGCKKFESIAKGADTLAGTCVDKLRSFNTVKIDDRLCTEMTSYRCEKRIYSPTVSNRDSLVEECGVNGDASLCLPVRVLEFNTEVARESGNETEFLPGGEYNRVDIQCVNRASQIKNISLIDGEGADVSSALNAAISKCHERSYL